MSLLLTMVCLHAQFLCSLRHNSQQPPTLKLKAVIRTWKDFFRHRASNRLFCTGIFLLPRRLTSVSMGIMWGDIYLPQRQKCQHWHAVVHLSVVQCPYCNLQGSRMGFWKSQGCSCRTVVHQHRVVLLRQWSRPLSTEKRDPSWWRRRTQVFT